MKRYKDYLGESKTDDKIYLDVTEIVQHYLDIFIPAIQEKEFDEVPNWIINKPNFIELLKKDIIKTIEYTLDAKCDDLAEIIEPESVFNDYKKKYPEEYFKNTVKKNFNL